MLGTCVSGFITNISETCCRHNNTYLSLVGLSTSHILWANPKDNLWVQIPGCERSLIIPTAAPLSLIYARVSCCTEAATRTPPVRELIYLQIAHGDGTMTTPDGCAAHHRAGACFNYMYSYRPATIRRLNNSLHCSGPQNVCEAPEGEDWWAAL